MPPHRIATRTTGDRNIQESHRTCHLAETVPRSDVMMYLAAVPHVPSRQFKRPSFIILSIGSVVALSAFLMGVNGLLSYFSGSAESSEGGGICSAGL